MSEQRPSEAPPAPQDVEEIQRDAERIAKIIVQWMIDHPVKTLILVGAAGILDEIDLD